MAKNKGQFKRGHVPANKKESVILSCKQCIKEFSVRPYRKDTAGFCSRSCASGWQMTGKRHHQYKGGKPKCLDCGKELSNYNNKYCVEHGRVIGARNGKWITDRMLLKDDHKDRGGSLSRDWGKRVKDRDGWKCRISNENCEGRMEAHHILGWSEHPELRYQLNNGITLCHAHHPLKRAEEKLMIPTFRGLLGLSIGN